MRKNIFIGALGVMAILLSSCSMENTENREGIVLVEEAAPTTAADAEPEKQSPVSDESPDTYREIYKQVVTETEGDALIFSLIYLDNDDIPELAVCDRGYEAYSIYTVKDGKVFCMMDAMITVEMVYFERKSVISQFSRWNGGGDEGGYGWYYYQVSTDKALVDGDLSTLHYTYDAAYDEEGNWTGEGVAKYYHMDQEIDEVAYQQMMNDLGIIEGNKKVLADNALGKVEMLDQLTEQGRAAEETEKESLEDGADEVEEQADVVNEAFEETSRSLADEEKLLNEKMEYYRKSAYYPEIIDYWENVREVRDVSNRITPLYESDIRYLTKEDLAFDPPVVIHLAKNEIYARHGYIFRDPDLYNYFMGCIWYKPTTAPEDFSDEVFNECEKENLKLLAELDTM